MPAAASVIDGVVIMSEQCIPALPYLAVLVMEIDRVRSHCVP